MVITTDSGSNPRNIDKMVPCVIVDSKDNIYYDMKKINDDANPSITNVEVFKRAFNKERFRTASPSISDYIILMTPYLEKGEDIIHLSMSSGISEGSVNSSMVAASMLNDTYGDGRVTIVDTLTGGSGGTIINDYANSLNKGVSKEYLINKILGVRSKIKTSFYIPKVEGFVNSGRAPKEARLLDKLSLRYRIDVNQSGKLYPKLPPYHGSIDSQFMKYLSNIINNNNKNDYDPNYLALLITSLNKINIDDVYDYLSNLHYFDAKLIDAIPFYGAISSYGVEDQVGVALIKK